MGILGKWSTSFGLLVYYLAGVKKKERRKMLSREETLKLVPLFREDQLLGAGYYVEYLTDDARLTIEVMKEAVHQRAKAINYMQVEEFIYKFGKVVGVQVIDQLTKQKYRVFAKRIVNATGPWGDVMRSKDHFQKGEKTAINKGDPSSF